MCSPESFQVHGFRSGLAFICRIECSGSSAIEMSGTGSRLLTNKTRRYSGLLGCTQPERIATRPVVGLVLRHARTNATGRWKCAARSRDSGGSTRAYPTPVCRDMGWCRSGSGADAVREPRIQNHKSAKNARGVQQDLHGVTPAVISRRVAVLSFGTVRLTE